MAIKAQIVPANMGHAIMISANVRDEDRDELWASSMMSPLSCMEKGMKYSEETFTGLINGVPVCMWGVVQDSFVFNTGTPWMVSAVQLEEHDIAFLRRARKPVLEMLEKYDKLENYVDARNTRSITWLRWMGFNVEEKTEIYGLLKKPFHRFTMTKEKSHV